MNENSQYNQIRHSHSNASRENVPTYQNLETSKLKLKTLKTT